MGKTSFAIALIYSWALMSVCATHANAQPDAPLRVGAAAVEITPPLAYPMSGYFHGRLSDGTLDPLHAKAMAFQQGEETAVVCVCDIIGVSRPLSDAVRRRAAAETGIPADRIILSATHSHTGPAYDGDLQRHLDPTGQSQPTALRDETKPTDYPKRLIEGIAAAIVQAVENTAPAELTFGAAQVDDVSFNRRFILRDGSVRTWAKLADPDVVRAAGPIDPGLPLLLVQRPGQTKPAAALAVFALHLDTVGGTKFSADYPFHMERRLRDAYGEMFSLVFGAGTCGDINHVDPTGAPRNSASKIGETLAAAFQSAATSAAPVAPRLGMQSRYVQLPLQPSTEDELAWAKRIAAQDRAGEQIEMLTEVKAYKLLYLHDLHRQSLGRTLDAADGHGLRYEPGKIPVEVQVLRLSDDVAIVSLPGEVFVELGLEIQRRSPFNHTLVIELAQSDEMAYIATRAGYSQGGYEPTNSAIAPGGGELLVETSLDVLNSLR